MKCKFCKSENTVKNGFVRGKQRYLCKDCSKMFTVGDERKKNEASKLFFDLLCCVKNVTKEEYIGIFAKHFGVGRRTVKQWINSRECEKQLKLKGFIQEFGNVDYVTKELIDRDKYFLCAAVNLDNKANAIIIVQRRD